MSAPPRLEVHTELAPVEGAWRELEARCAGSAFQSWAWLSTWQATVGQAAGLRPQVVLVTASGRLVMLLPLALERRRLATALVWLGGDLSDYHGGLLAPDCPPELLSGPGFLALWDQVLAALPPVNLVHLDRQLDQLCGHPNPFLALGAVQAPSSSHQAHLGPAWPAWYSAKASSKTRQTHRRKARKLAERGPVELLLPARGAEVPAVLDAMLAQKSRSYRELGVRDLFAEPAHRAFVQRLTSEHPDLVHLSALRSGGEVVATHWGLLYRGTFYYLLPTYQDGEIERLSPGGELRLRLLQWCCEQGVHTFDFTLGEEPYKDRWCEQHLAVYSVLVARTARGRAVVAAAEAGTELKRRIKASPRLYELAKDLRSRLPRGG